MSRERKKDLRLFVTCPPGMEPLLLQELPSLGYDDVRSGYRGVHVGVSSLREIYRLNYCSRCASRVLLPLKVFPCWDRDSLYKAAEGIAWEEYIPEGSTMAVDANVHHRAFRNSLFAAQVVKDAVCDRLRACRGTRPSVQVWEPDVQLNLFLEGDKGILSFDTSGSPLHRRGYRQQSVEAPLQENVAAGLLMKAGYQASDVLVDPCCGSGTFLVEAALISTQTPPGYLRKRWGFFTLPGFRRDEWAEVKKQEEARRLPLLPGKLMGVDSDARAVTAAKVNARAAGFQDILFVQSDFRAVSLPFTPTLVVANPPHGLRLQRGESLTSLYKALGDFIRQHGKHGFVLIGGAGAARDVGLVCQGTFPLSSGGQKTVWTEFHS